MLDATMLDVDVDEMTPTAITDKSSSDFDVDWATFELVVISSVGRMVEFVKDSSTVLTASGSEDFNSGSGMLVAKVLTAATTVLNVELSLAAAMTSIKLGDVNAEADDVDSTYGVCEASETSSVTGVVAFL